MALLNAITPTFVCSSLLQPCLALQILQRDRVHRCPAAYDIPLLYEFECRVCALFLHLCCHTNGVDHLLLRPCHALGSPTRQKPQRSSKAAAARLAMRLL